MRSLPNIIITGTPGVGKSSHCELLVTKTNLKHLKVNEVAEQRGCFDGRDEELGSWIVDEDKVINIVMAALYNSADSKINSWWMRLSQT
jgi:adenylate kinase